MKSRMMENIISLINILPVIGQLAEELTAISHLPITERTVRKLQDAGLVDAVWFSDKVPSKEERPAWHCRAVSVLSACDIVFLDPDNGLLVKSVGKGSARSVKYVFPEEIADYIAQGISVVFYNHRQRKAEDVYFRGIRERLDTQNELRYCAFSKITFPKCSVRDYILLCRAVRPPTEDRYSVEQPVVRPFWLSGTMQKKTVGRLF